MSALLKKIKIIIFNVDNYFTFVLVKSKTIYKLNAEEKNVNTSQKKQYEQELENLNTKIEGMPNNVELLKQRGALYYKLEEYGKAINDYSKVISLEPDNTEVKTQIEMIKTILRFANTDIYASPNTNMDPWLE